MKVEDIEEVVVRELVLKFKRTNTAQALTTEVLLHDTYDVKSLALRPGAIVDFGANEGMFSIWMGLKHPDCTVYAFEPVPSTFEILRENIALNVVGNVLPFNFGIGPVSNTGNVEMIVSKDYTGGSSSLIGFNEKDHYKVTVLLRSVDDIFNRLGIENCELMKVDVEGAEYAALYDTHVWEKVKRMVIEVHMNNRLGYEGYRADSLVTWLRNRTDVLKVRVCRMAD